MIHWWVAGMFCDAPLAVEDGTAEPDRVTCPRCLVYVQAQLAIHGLTAEGVGEAVRALP